MTGEEYTAACLERAEHWLSQTRPDGIDRDIDTMSLLSVGIALAMDSGSDIPQIAASVISMALDMKDKR